MRYGDSDFFSWIQLLGSVNVKILSILQNEHRVLNTVHKIINIEFTAVDTVSLCLKILMHSQQHLYAVDLIFRNEEDQLLNLMSPLVFNEVRHIKIDVIKINDVILFHILHVIKIGYELVSTIIIEHNMRDIINEINANHDLKGAVKTVAESLYVEFSIDFTEVSDIYIKLLFKFKSDAVRGQSVKEFRQDNGLILTSLRKQSGDISITDLIQQCFTHHICENDSV